MEKKKLKLLIGIQTFEDIRTEGYVNTADYGLEEDLTKMAL